MVCPKKWLVVLGLSFHSDDQNQRAGLSHPEFSGSRWRHKHRLRKAVPSIAKRTSPPACSLSPLKMVEKPCQIGRYRRCGLMYSYHLNYPSDRIICWATVGTSNQIEIGTS